MSRTPLVPGCARQTMTATFGAEGFRAAAATTFAAVYQGRSPEEPPYGTTRVMACFDRPLRVPDGPP
ncbi:hypothetical protein QNO09_19065 [Streptomyces sp. 378]|uniref:hypothetical protein n=1 Tax=Streptomyces sp. 378 TaxID=3049412 RepID=UPI0024C36D52|nr:hypothetical protein [Streptomyces sp. 378]MDK1345359.1 hypothetical protein [Streptomyces sp. 378]